MSSTAVLRHQHSQLAKRGHVGHDGAGEHLPGRLGDVLGLPRGPLASLYSICPVCFWRGATIRTRHCALSNPQFRLKSRFLTVSPIIQFRPPAHALHGDDMAKLGDAVYAIPG